MGAAGVWVGVLGACGGLEVSWHAHGQDVFLAKQTRESIEFSIAERSAPCEAIMESMVFINNSVKSTQIYYGHFVLWTSKNFTSCPCRASVVPPQMTFGETISFYCVITMHFLLFACHLRPHQLSTH